MSLQLGHSYKIKTYTHNFLDDITVVSIYQENGFNLYVVVRNSGQIYHMTQQDIDGADFYELGDDLTEPMTDYEDDDDDNDDDFLFDPNQIFVDFDIHAPLD
jgi:hypothetical protein